MSILESVIVFVSVITLFASVLLMYPHVVRATSRYWYEGKIESYAKQNSNTPKN